MSEYQVTCISKLPRSNPYEGITHVGGTAYGGWRLTREDVINRIRSKSETFYTLVNGKRANIGVVDDPDGAYLRTYADSIWNDNLLALPECQ